MQLPQPDGSTPYPIILCDKPIDKEYKDKFTKHRWIRLCSFSACIGSILILFTGIGEYKNLEFVIAGLVGIPAALSFFISFELDQSGDIILLVDERGLEVRSNAKTPRKIFLPWHAITGIHFAWESPSIKAERFNRLFSQSGQNILPYRAHEVGDLATVTISYKLPPCEEHREGSEARNYQFTDTFGMSQTDFFDFLKLHFERNKRA